MTNDVNGLAANRDRAAGANGTTIGSGGKACGAGDSGTGIGGNGSGGSNENGGYATGGGTRSGIGGEVSQGGVPIGTEDDEGWKLYKKRKSIRDGKKPVTATGKSNNGLEARSNRGTGAATNRTEVKSHNSRSGF